MAIESKYATKFTGLTIGNNVNQMFRFRGPNLLVETIKREEIKSKAGIILQGSSSQKAQSSDYQRDIGLVLMVGEGYTDSPCEVPVGALILMPFNSIYLSQWPALNDYTQNTLAIVADSDVMFYFTGEKAMEQAREILNA